MDHTVHKIFPGSETIIPGRFPIFPGSDAIILRQFPLLKIPIKFQAPLIPSPVKGHSKQAQQFYIGEDECTVPASSSTAPATSGATASPQTRQIVLLEKAQFRPNLGDF